MENGSLLPSNRRISKPPASRKDNRRKDRSEILGNDQRDRNERDARRFHQFIKTHIYWRKHQARLFRILDAEIEKCSLTATKQ
jgi:hypothetical protein